MLRGTAATQSSTGVHGSGPRHNCTRMGVVKAGLRVIAVLVVVVALLFAATRYLASRLVPAGPASVAPETALVGRPMPDLTGLAWLQSKPPATDSLRDAPAVVVVFSDTDPVALRALPALETWHEAYGRFGVRVIGVHQPEFAFAAAESVAAAFVRRAGLGFPVALDPGYRLRAALGAPAGGPLVVLGDGSRIVSAARGAEGMTAMESRLRTLVRARHPDVPFPPDPAPRGTTTATAASRDRSDDIVPFRTVHLGTARVREGPLLGAAPGSTRPYTAQFRYQVEGKRWVPYPVGSWTAFAEGVTAARGGAETLIALRYDAGVLWAVMSPPPDGSARVWLLLDERWPGPAELGADARRDTRGAAYVEVTEPRLYELCRAAAGEHVMKLSPESPGVTLHALIVERSPAPR